MRKKMVILLTRALVELGFELPSVLMLEPFYRPRVKETIREYIVEYVN